MSGSERSGGNENEEVQTEQGEVQGVHRWRCVPADGGGDVHLAAHQAVGGHDGESVDCL